jgi:hypothetical protein
MDALTLVLSSLMIVSSFNVLISKLFADGVLTKSRIAMDWPMESSLDLDLPTQNQTLTAVILRSGLKKLPAKQLCGQVRYCGGSRSFWSFLRNGPLQRGRM